MAYHGVRRRVYEARGPREDAFLEAGVARARQGKVQKIWQFLHFN